ncbi:MAG: sigma-70 family RNA polymerase sigma factor [Peptococcaceae bacterium]|jgi:RNA polymerase sigma-70 factor (ECF subfamily)|nr:sigma-70 family RNA polymerase sigma factor [Peptococcaceae bacterium]
MDDEEIIGRFWERSESAICALDAKYAKYCRSIAYNILGNAEETEEVLNDAYSRVWNAIPPERPKQLRAFIGKIARNLSLDRLAKTKASKRGGGQMDLILSELAECIADRRNPYDELAETAAITDALNTFLAEQSVQNRRVFVRRYWRAVSLEAIAGDCGMSIGQVKSILFRMRKKLRQHLESEGIDL